MKNMTFVGILAAILVLSLPVASFSMGMRKSSSPQDNHSPDQSSQYHRTYGGSQSDAGSSISNGSSTMSGTYGNQETPGSASGSYGTGPSSGSSGSSSGSPSGTRDSTY